MSTKIFINKKSFSARAALILAILAIPFIITGKYSLLFNFSFSNIPLVTEVVLPLIGCILFIIVLLLLGRIFFSISFIPVVLCIVPIILQALKLGTIVGIGEAIICLLAIILYTCIMFGALKIKFIPIFVFVIEILYRIYFYIYKNFSSGASLSVQDALYHIAMLYLLAAFVFALIGLDKKVKVVASGKEVIPPIPGTNTLGQAPAPVFSAPAPNSNILSEEVDAGVNNQEKEPMIIEMNHDGTMFAESEELTDNSAVGQTETIKNTSIKNPFEPEPNEEPADSVQQGIRNFAEKIKSKFVKSKEKEPEQPHDIKKGAEEIGQIEEN